MAILAVDDDILNLKLIEKLVKKKYPLTLATSAKEALQILDTSEKPIKCILLDWNMPEMNGLEFLKVIKANKKHQHIPVVIQTIDTSKESILTGIRAGAFQYLLKPYDEKSLMSHVHLSLLEYERYHHLLRSIERNTEAFSLLEKAEFRFRSLEQSNKLAYSIASIFPDPENVVIGIIDLLCNAIEHGNLKISYEEKTMLLEEDRWHEEVERRLSLPENENKFVRVLFEKTDKFFKIYIQDQGEGFNYQKYLSMDESRLFDSHGRGIFMARAIAFDEVRYLGKGNEVEAIVYKKIN